MQIMEYLRKLERQKNVSHEFQQSLVDCLIRSNIWTSPKFQTNDDRLHNTKSVIIDKLIGAKSLTEETLS